MPDGLELVDAEYEAGRCKDISKMACIVRDVEGNLFAAAWDATQWDFEFHDAELIPVEANQVTTINYKRSDGRQW